MHASRDQPIQTLRISERDRAKLIESVDSASVKKVQDDRRRLRVSYNQCKAVLTLLSESGNATRFIVIPRNLSRLGVAFVHGRFVFPQSRCEVLLQSLDQQWHAIAGRVTSCRHVQGMVHEIAVRFDQAIDLPAFAVLTPEQEMLNLEDVTRDLPPEEAAKVQRLAGRVLVVDGFAMDRKLFNLWLSRSGFQADGADDAVEALKKVASDRYDLVVVEVHLGGDSGLDLIRDLCCGSLAIPVLAMSAQDSDAVREQALQAGAKAFLGKPFTEEQLIQQCHTLLGNDTDNPDELCPIYSSSANDEELKPLLAEFIRGINGYITQLRDANAHKDFRVLQAVARALKGAGTGYGFPPITAAATDLLDQLTHDHAQDQAHDQADPVRKQVNELVAILNRVRL